MQSLPAAGSLVVIRQQRWRVERAFRHGPVIEIDAVGATFFVPFDRVLPVSPRARPRRVRPQKWRGLVAHAFATAESYDLPLAARTAAIDVLSHQLEPCLTAMSGVRRLLIADEVGLGKTIEAGLIVAEAMRRSDAQRVLILAPATLCDQWRDELSERFGITARLVDAEWLRETARDLPRDLNPWTLDGVYLASVDFIKQPHVLDGLPDQPWDILVIDEAHTLCGDSTRHDAGDEIAKRSRQVILLTATPHSGDDVSARRLERLGALAGLEDDDALVVFRRTRLDIGPGPLRRIRRVRVRLAEYETRTLDLLKSFDRAARDAATSDTCETTELLLSIFNKRALSTFGALLSTIDRRLAFLDGAEISNDADQLSFSFGDGDEAEIAVRIGLPVDRERNWLRRLRAVAVIAATIESKIARLRALMARTAEPVIVFTEFRDSLEIAARRLGGAAGVAVAHGGLAQRLMTDALDRFRSGDARVLIATDVASQGLNLQHRCRWVIHLDRPWNPVKLEQRAGRVDRLGQVRDVHVTELMTSHDREFELAERVGRRAQAAATSEWLRPCDRWRRRARAAARVLNARRRLAAEWRGAEGIARPVSVKQTASPPYVPRGSRHCRRTGTLARGTYGANAAHLLRVDIRDGDGRLRESVLSRGGPAAASAKADARLRRLARLAGERAAQRAAVARALGARRRQALTQLTLPGTVSHSPAAIESHTENVESAANESLLSSSDPRLIALERD